MRIIPLIFLAVALVLPRVAVAADGNHAHVHALLVVASNQRGASDSRLSAYEPTLRSILRFESYRLAGEGSANIASPGKASANLGGGHSLELETEKSGGGSVRIVMMSDPDGVVVELVEGGHGVSFLGITCTDL